MEPKSEERGKKALRSCPETMERNHRWNMHEVAGAIAWDHVPERFDRQAMVEA